MSFLVLSNNYIRAVLHNSVTQLKTLGKYVSTLGNISDASHLHYLVPNL